MKESIRLFFESPAYAIIGASTDRTKYGNIALRTFLKKKIKVYPVNPRSDKVEGLKAFNEVTDLPDEVKSIVTVVPPQVTEVVVEKALSRGIKNIWMQPGSESQRAIDSARKAGINVIHNTCVINLLKRYSTLEELLKELSS